MSVWLTELLKCSDIQIIEMAGEKEEVIQYLVDCVCICVCIREKREGERWRERRHSEDYFYNLHKRYLLKHLLITCICLCSNMLNFVALMYA